MDCVEIRATSGNDLICRFDWMPELSDEPCHLRQL